MSTPIPKDRMSFEAFEAWTLTLGEGERYELHDGYVVAQASERVAHNTVKTNITVAFVNQIKAKGLACRTFADGMLVRIDTTRGYEPDVAVRCGGSVDPDATHYDDPEIVVEVVSRGSENSDTGAKVEGYFALPSVRHYLIVKTDTKAVIHHARDGEGRIATTIQSQGVIDLAPPGLVLALDEVFEGL